MLRNFREKKRKGDMAACFGITSGDVGEQERGDGWLARGGDGGQRRSEAGMCERRRRSEAGMCERRRRSEAGMCERRRMDGEDKEGREASEAQV